MKYLSKKRVTLRDKEFGGEDFFSIVSVIPCEKTEMTEQLQEAFISGADAVEIKLTRYQAVKEIPRILFAETIIKERTVPLILNLNQAGTDHKTAEYIKSSVAEDCINKKLVDAIEISFDANRQTAESLSLHAHQNGVQVICSCYDYLGISSSAAVAERAVEMEKTGADLIKLMYLADNDVDLIRAAEAAKKLKQEALVEAPFCISTMNDVGLMYRVLADRCGNDFSYSVLKSGDEGMLLETFEQYQAFRELFHRD